MEEKELKPISIRVAPKEDFILKEILSRVNEKKRTEFVKEAIFYWDYIIKHSTLGTRLLRTDKSKKQVIDNLFPESYYRKRDEPDMSLKEKFENVEIKTIRFDIGTDELELQEICSRAVSLEWFVKEAIFEWDCLVNTSNIFLSRFIKRKEDSIQEWHIPSMKVSEKENKLSDEPSNKLEVSTNQTNETIATSNQSNDIVTTSGVESSSAYSAEDNKEKLIGTQASIDTNTTITTQQAQQPQLEQKTTITRGRKNSMKW